MSPVAEKLKNLLPGIPSEIVQHIAEQFEQLQHHFIAGRHEPSELNGAKFAEAVFRFLEWKASGTFTKFGQHISNFGVALKKFENKPDQNDSVRFHIPKALDILFTLRNKRGVGHLAGDIDPNDLDSMLVERISSWTLAELVRLQNDTNATEAHQIVNSLTDRPVPAIWSAFGRDNILVKGLKYADKVLLLLSAQPDKAIHLDELQKSIRHPDKRDLRKILIQLQNDGLIAFDTEIRTALISPLGERHVDQMDLPTLN